MRKRIPDALSIDLLATDVYRRFSSRPEPLLELARAQPQGKVIIIDEIQRIPELLSNVHLLIEEKKGWFFVLTRSNARKLRKAGVNLLGGRALKKTLHPLIAHELGDTFNFKEALKYGLLPLRFGCENPDEILSTYVSLYLDEEVKSEGLFGA